MVVSGPFNVEPCCKGQLTYSNSSSQLEDRAENLHVGDFYNSSSIAL